MKFLIAILLLFSIIPAQSQEIDKLYYILGFSEDLSFPIHYRGKLKSGKLGFTIHENNLDKVCRFSEVTGFKFKKCKPEEDCLNCHKMFKFIKIPSLYKLKNFYDFKDSKSKEFYYGLGEVELEKQQGFLKTNILTNATQLQMKSFLAGAYLDVGTIKGDTVKLEYFATQNQKLEILKDFINKIEPANFFGIKEQKERLNNPDFLRAQTVLMVPNMKLMDLFRNEEERKKVLLSSFNDSKK